MMRKGALRSRMGLSPVFKDINSFKKWNEWEGELRRRSHPAKFPIYGMELKKHGGGTALVLALVKQVLMDL